MFVNTPTPGCHPGSEGTSHLALNGFLQQCLVFLLATGLLAACGGGGGSSSPPANTTPAPPPANVAPVAAFTISQTSGTAPLDVATDASGSSDSDGTITAFEWDFDGTAASGASAAHTFDSPGTYTVTLTVTDDDGESASTSVSVTADAPATTFSVSGSIDILNTTSVDSDVNDRLTTPRANNDFDNAQPLPNPAILGGFANQPNTGASTGNLHASGDSGDFYQVNLAGGELVTLNIADLAADLDLRLYDDSRNLIDSSLGLGSNESLEIDTAGTYFIEVFPFLGASNYVLTVGRATTSTIARAPTRLSDPFVPGELIVSYRAAESTRTPAAPTRAAGARFIDAEAPVRTRLQALRAQQLRLPAGVSASPALRARMDTLVQLKLLRRTENVAWAEPNLLLTRHATPNDPFFPRQWHYDNVNLPLAWDTTTGSTGVIVAVIDTGVLVNHPDLQANLVGGYDFISDPQRARDGDGIDANPDDVGDQAYGGSSSFHGTHVAGTVAASTDNSAGVAGASWQTRIMPLRVLGVDGGTSFDINQAIRFAAGLSNDSGTVPPQRADIINLSLGSPFPAQSTQDAITAARAAGVIVIASAGNESSSAPFYPASHDGVVSVSATTITNSQASYSNSGASVDIAAPGGSNTTDLNGDGIADGVISTAGDDSGGTINFGYSAQAGTSMSAPHVAGIAALMKAIHPGLTPAQFDAALQAGDMTDDLGAAGRDDVYGFGLINAQKAVLAAQELASGGTPTPTPVLSASPGTLSFGAFLDSLTTTLRNAGGGALQVLSASADVSWVTITGPGTADGLGDYEIRIDRDALTDGAYQATVTFTSTANTAQVNLVMQVSSDPFSADAGLFYVILIDSNDNVVSPAVLSQANDGRYAFTIPDVPQGTYRLFAGSDADDDELICDTGESCGAWPTLDSPQAFEVDANLDDRDFTSAFRFNLAPVQTGANNSPAGIAVRKSGQVQ